MTGNASHLKCIFVIGMGLRTTLYYTLYLYSGMENLSQQHQNGISILKKNSRFESVLLYT